MFFNIFIGWFVLNRLVILFLEVLNLNFSRNKKRRIPAPLESIITPDRFKLSIDYLKDRTLFRLFRGTLELFFTLFLIIIIAPGLEKFVLIHFSSTLWQGLFYFGILFLFNFIVSIPFSLYEDFHIEKKYSFNKSTYKIFFTDSIKSILITFLLGGFLLSGILFYLNKYTIWWWQLSILSSLTLICAIWLFPIILYPFFNKFKPLEDGELKNAIINFATLNQININKIFVMDASKRSIHGNAFLTGMGSSRRIVLFDTILDYPKNEILSIIAHEWGHHKNHDIYKQLFTSILSFITILFLSNLLFMSGTIQKAFIVQTPYSILFYSFSLISPIIFFLSPLTNFLIRKQEYEADKFSLLMTGDLSSSLDSLKRLIRDNLSNLNPHPIFRLFYYTHPAPAERIEHLLKLADQYKIN